MSENLHSLELFHQYTATWFRDSIGKPTKVQQEAWPIIADGGHTLVSAPTGTGKTLTAFLVFVDRLLTQAREGTLKQELQLIYVSPLKSLAGDIRENLKRPLHGIQDVEFNELNISVTERITQQRINIAIRTGDTTQQERRKMLKTPPHILITTPESLYLLLTSKSSQKILCTAQAIIIDELHALIDTKRGAHMMLTIARLDKLCEKPLQRIGLSATIEPIELAAEYLSPDSVTAVTPKMKKRVQILVTSSNEDKKSLQRSDVWQELAVAVYERCKDNASTIAFVAGRSYAERLAYYVNQLGGEGFAKTHHGSLSKEQRFDVEESLREGNLRLLVATSTMELGIDVGEISQVLQIGCPGSISSTLQRLGRAGHNPGRVSVMHMFPRTPLEALYCGLTAKVATDGGVEHSNPPTLCLDVLAQHLVSMATGEGYTVDDVMVILVRAYPFRTVTKEDVKSVLCMLAGDYEHENDIPVRPRLLYDRIHEKVEGDTYSRMLAVMSGGTIPDRGLYTVKTDNGVKIGELDEEYVYEAQIGDKFLLGTFAWKILRIDRDNVTVSPATTGGARPPFWRGEIKGRPFQTGITFGKILRKLSCINDKTKFEQELIKLGLDQALSTSVTEFLQRQKEATGVLLDDKTIVVEHFYDETGSNQIMVHSIFGRQVNTPLGILACELAQEKTHTNIEFFTEDDGFLLYPYNECELPEGLLQEIRPEMARTILTTMVPATTQFAMLFRYNAARALMFGVQNGGRQPLWMQRLRGVQLLDSVIKYEDHPLIRETKRECLEDYWDIKGVETILQGIQSGSIQICEVFTENPSPMSYPLRKQTEATMMYNYSPTTVGIQQVGREVIKQQINMITPSKEQLAKVTERKHIPENEQQLHSLLMIEGDVVAGELEVSIDWFESLAKKELACYIEPGLWIAAEQTKQYEDALVLNDIEAKKHIIRRVLRYRGAMTIEDIARRYYLPMNEVQQILDELLKQENVVESEGIYYHADLYATAQKATIKNRREQIQTMPAQCYAALQASLVRKKAPAIELVERTLKLLCDRPYPFDLWEKEILPTRVPNYKADQLDVVLSQGNYFWQVTDGSKLSFHHSEDIDWEVDMSTKLEELEGNEGIIYEALLKRGASFMQSMNRLLDGESSHDTLLKMVREGIVKADSFLPIRLIIKGEKIKPNTVKQRVNNRVKALTNGRYELSRPRVELSMEQKLERIFDHAIIVCRETIQEVSWKEALETLRVWEYTGRVRRGYFIEGLSGVQFIRDKDFASTMIKLRSEQNQVIWLSAIDPAQVWGKCFPHCSERTFLNVIGTAVALKDGKPVAVFERQGKVLRIFDMESFPEAITSFKEDFLQGYVYPFVRRIVIKEYPQEAKEELQKNGFMREAMDYVLYR